MSDTERDAFEAKTERNDRVQTRYDELMREGKHGHYETMFRVVREEVERARRSTEAPQLTDEQREVLESFLVISAPDASKVVSDAHMVQIARIICSAFLATKGAA